MKVKGIGHYAVSAANYAESIKFYRDIVGLVELHTTHWDGFDMTTLEMPDGGLLELFDFGNRECPKIDPNAVGYKHFAFLVEDVDAWEAYLKEAGVKITMSAVDMPALGTRGMLCLDPNGLETEFYTPIK